MEEAETLRQTRAAGASPTMEPAGAVIEVSRDAKGTRDRRRAYRVVVDGEVVGTLRQSDHGVFHVAPGEHDWWIAVDWCRSRITRVELAPGAIVAYRCRPNGPGLRAVVDAIVRRNDYVAVERL